MELKELYQIQVQLEKGMREEGIRRYSKHFQFHQERDTLSNTMVGQKLLKQIISKVYIELDQRVAKAKHGAGGRRHASVKLLYDLDLRVVAYLSLKAVLNNIARANKATQFYKQVGGMIEEEVMLREFREQDEKLFDRLFKLSKERFQQSYKVKLFKSVGKKEDISIREWSPIVRGQLGAFLVDVIMTSTNIIVEEIVNVPSSRGKAKKEKYIQATEQCLKLIEEFNEYAGSLFIYYEPMVVEPKGWHGPYGGGYYTHNVKPINLVKSYNQNYFEELKTWEMPIVYKAINTLQNTPYVVDEDMLTIHEQLRASNAVWSGIPPTYNEEEPPYPVLLDGESEDDFNVRTAAWRRESTQIKKDNRELVSKRATYVQTLVTASKFSDFDEIFFPLQLDFRGRIYCVPTFNYQGPDWMKSMVRLAHGKPLGAEGVDALAKHIANLADDVSVKLGGGGKLTKLSSADRVQWVYDNTDMILRWTTAPMENREWSLAGKKERFQLLQASKDWAGYIREGEGYVSNLIVCVDASCSGLQHYAGALRCAETGREVNLLPSDLPNDFYQTIADKVALRVREDASQGHVEAAQWLEWGVDGRNLYKRNAMTYSYSSRTFGFKEQLMEDHLTPRFRDVCRWKRKLDNMTNQGFSDESIVAFTLQKPVWPFEGTGAKAAMYLAKYIYEALNATVVKAAEGMEWLRSVAMIAAKNNLPLNWTTPVNFPVQQAYWKEKGHRVDTVLNGSKRIQFILNECTDEIDVRRQANAVAPNFIHGNDSSHLMLTVVRSAQKGVTAMTCIHDSFGCLPADMGGIDGFFMTIREAFIEMYTTVDVFKELHDHIKSCLPEHLANEVPPIPTKGSLDIDQVELSRYCFA